MYQDDVERYVSSVLRNVPLPPDQRARIGADLRAHLNDAIIGGEPPAVAIAKMGSPTEVAAAFTAGSSLSYAARWRRLLAFLIDLLVLAAGETLLFFVISVSSARVPPGTTLVPPSTNGLTYVIGAILVAWIIICAAAMLALYILYFPLQEARAGKTIGKRVLGVRVVRESGLAIGNKEAFLRRIPFYFRFQLIDALFVFFSARRQRAFEMVAHTVVIDDR